MRDFNRMIVETNFGRLAKRFAVFALCMLLIGGGLSGYALRTQIGEALDCARNWEKTERGDKGEKRTKKDGGLAKEILEASRKGEEGKKDSVSTLVRSGAEREERREKDGDFEKNSARHKEGHREKDRRDHGDFEDFLKRAVKTRPGMAAKITLAAFAAACAGLAAAYWLITAAWLYKAAALANMNPLMWALAGLCFNLAALVLFILCRGRKTRCPTCGRWQADHPFCRFCGAPLQQKCSRCGLTLPLSNRYCPNCGNELDPHGSQDVQR